MAVIPGKCYCDRKSDDEDTQQYPTDQLRPVKRMGKQLLTVRERKGSPEVGKAPLKDLVFFDASPGVYRDYGRR
jgi:hypothetical protein